MQIFIKFLVISVFLVLISFFIAFNFNKTAIVSAQQQPDYKKIYLQNCARCHGADGKSKTELGKKFDSPDLTRKKTKKRQNEKLYKKIAEGKGDMPAFGKRFSSENINGLIDYIKTL